MNESGFLKALDWTALLDRLTAEAQSPGGRALCAGLSLAANPREAVRRMAAVTELATLLQTGEPLPSLAAPDIAAVVAAAEKGLVLGADDVRPLGEMINIADGVRRALLGPDRAPIPEISALADGLDPPRGL